MIYFTADTHFYHKKVIEYAKRPFSNVEKMNERLIQNWNRRVTASDEVYILGDLTLKGGNLASQVLGQLKGKKYLITGNHDKFLESSQFQSSLLAGVYPYYELCYESQQFVLFHYPITEWNGFFHGAIHLHGHLHSPPTYNMELRQKGIRKYDVGVDGNHMTPVSVEEIISFFHNAQ